MIKTYKSPKLTLADDEIFCFGANLNGFHGFGSAGYASFGEFGNVWRKYEYDKKPNGWKGKWNVKGASVGPQVGTEGKSYAIPTVTRAGMKRSIPLETIKGSIQAFYSFAKSRPHLKFFVAQGVEGNLNGYSAEEMASIYSGEIPENVYFDEGFASLLNVHKNADVHENANTIDFMNKKCHCGGIFTETSINDDKDGVLHCDSCGEKTSRYSLKCKCIIAGSRSITDYSLICAAVKESGFQIDEVVSGNAKGADSLGEKYALHNSIPLKQFPAPWNKIEGKPRNEIGQTNYGKKFWKKAGPFRNQQMADYATHLILVWDGKSSGSSNMLELAKKKGLTIYEKIFTD